MSKEQPTMTMVGSYKLTEFEMSELIKHVKQTMIHWPDPAQQQVSREQIAVTNAVRKLGFALDVERMGE